MHCLPLYAPTKSPRARVPALRLNVFHMYAFQNPLRTIKNLTKNLIQNQACNASINYDQEHTQCLPLPPLPPTIAGPFFFFFLAP